MAERLGTIVATRKLHGRGGKTIVVSIGKPRAAEKGDWACPYRIGGTQVKWAYGLDAFQALIMAIEAIRVELGSRSARLSWEGGEVGDTGVPRFVPTFYGVTVAKRLERFIDIEVRRFARKAQAKYGHKRYQSRRKSLAR